MSGFKYHKIEAEENVLKSRRDKGRTIKSVYFTI